MKKMLLLICILASNGISAQEQYKLLLMNGQEIPVFDFNDTSFTHLQFTFDKNHIKRERLHIKERRKANEYFNTNVRSEKADDAPIVMREGRRSRNEVFAVRHPNGTEKVYYYFSEEDGNYLSEPEVRSFIAGQGDARIAVAGKGWLWAGLGIGAATGYAARGSLLALAVPPLFALSTKIPVVQIPAPKISNLSYQHDPDYAAGFETQVRSRNIRQALKGSAMGTVLGLIAFAIVDNNR